MSIKKTEQADVKSSTQFKKTEMVIFENVILGMTFYDKQSCEKLEHIC